MQKKTAIAFVTLLITSGLTFQAHALDCRQVERLGNALKERILSDIRGHSEGLERELTKRKTLHIHSIDDLRFDGCKAIIDATVEMERKVRRDAHGNARIVGKIGVGSLSGDELCFKSAPKIERLKLSNTTRLGEGVYKWLGNTIWPLDRCYPVNL